MCRDQGADLGPGPSQVDYLLCVGKCQTRVNRQLFRSLRKNSIGTLMRQSKLLVSGTVPTSVIIQTSDFMEEASHQHERMSFLK